MADLLVVEDDPDVAQSLTSVLADEGHVVRLATNGKDGLAKIADGAPDAVLLDVEMPRLDGPGIAYQLFIRDCGAEKIPIILVSAVAHLKAVAERVGTPYYLGKPFAIEALVVLLRRVPTERRPPVPPRRS